MISSDCQSVHEQGYVKRRDQGAPGWQSDLSLSKTLATLAGELDQKHVPREGRVLELGCGAGDLSLLLARRGYQCSGVDFSPSAISWAVEKSGQAGVEIDFQVGNVLLLSQYADESFDLIVDGYCFHCIIGEDRLRFLAEVKRLLKPGGFFLLQSMCGQKEDDLLTVKWDRESGIVFNADGLPTRYIGPPHAILSEVTRAGLLVFDWKVQARTEEINDFDELVAWIQKT